MVVEAFAVIGAGSVATKRVPSFEVHFGVPARKVLDIVR
jgi:acetyltransferase-like isoleucine patch superfamily enzyme